MLLTMPSGILRYVFGKSVSIQVSPLSYLLILATTKVEQSDVVLLCNMSKQYLTLQLIKISMLHHVTACSNMPRNKVGLPCPL